MSTLLQAILWNNHGARLLELGDLENAFVWIHSAASIVDSVVSMLAPVHNAGGASGGVGDATMEPFHFWPDDNHPLDFVPTEPTSLHMKPTDPGRAQEHTRHFLQGLQPINGMVSPYQQPIFLSTSIGTVSLENNGHDKRFAHGAILYNLALTSHLSGLEASSDDAPACWEGALELYNCSLGLVDVDVAPGKRDILGVNIVIGKCLILNNMAHILYELRDYRECASCLRCLQEVLDQTGILEDCDAVSDHMTAASGKVCG
jgi:hypothetical protein